MSLIDLDELIKKADDLQPLPASTTKLVSVANSPDSNVDEITKIISFDPPLTMRLLRTANSAFSGTALTITTVHEAVSRLGTARVLSLAVASHTKPMMRIQVRAYGLNEGDLWKHSVIAMLAAEQAAKVCGVTVPPAASTAALLHDIGKLVMATFLSPEILDFLEQAKKEAGMSPLEAERQVLQVHHGELGGLVARHWKLPEAIVTGITYHHNPEEGGSPVCDVVCLANSVAKQVEANLAQRKTQIEPDPQVLQRLAVPAGGFEKLCALTAASFDKTGSLYGVTG